jgi:hypothetical protein
MKFRRFYVASGTGAALHFYSCIIYTRLQRCLSVFVFFENVLNCRRIERKHTTNTEAEKGLKEKSWPSAKLFPS